MRKLKVINHMSLDGVIQNSPEDGFPYRDWGAPYRTPEGRDFLLKTYGERYDVLLGRRTYDMWSTFWPQMPAGDPFGDRLRAATKYVVTHRPESLEWGPFEAIGPDLVEGIRRVKESEGPDLVCCGSSTLTSALIQHGLADELVLPINPVLVGAGKRLFTEGTPGAGVRAHQGNLLLVGDRGLHLHARRAPSARVTTRGWQPQRWELGMSTRSITGG